MKPHNVERVLEMPGVYRLWLAGPEPVPLYVGCTDHSIRRRLEMHLSDSETNPCIRKAVEDGACYFDILILTSQYKRRWTERSEILRLNPRCN